MILVVDTNIIIAAALRPGITQELLFKDLFQFYSPEFVKDEIEKHKTEIMKKSGFTEYEFETVFSLLFSEITIVPSKEYSHLKNEVLRFSPDREDWPFLALAKHLHAVLWSNDSDLKKKQDIIRVITTTELLGLLKGR